MRKLLLVLMLAIVPFAGCGDDDGDDTAGDAATGTSEAGSGDGDGTDFSGSDSGDFCDLARQYEKDFADTGEAATAADVEREYKELTAALDNLVDEAPDEIKADAEVVNAAFQKFNAVLEKYDYDFAKIPPEEADELDLDGPEIESASNRVEAYFEKVCKIDSDDDGDIDGVIEKDGATSGDEQAPDDTTADTDDDETTETTEG